MFARVNKKLKSAYTAEIRNLAQMKNCANKKNKNVELLKMKKSIKKIEKDKKNGDHIELVKRLTTDGDDLVSPEKVNSQTVLDYILTEHNMDDVDESE